ncbi:MAG: LON peptidase substrate-binding domain-containing protein [Proteobacteria bacterium]|nr:LON peptidase substrate-binding domain-containing protein [Pseudomonadota bacterium]
MSAPSGPTFNLADLPRTLPVFPLAGVLLLPQGRLPLHIFEPRYRAMTADAVMTRERLIGMIQPTESEPADRPPRLYPTGCAGRITSFTETEDGRFLMTLTGICRFTIGEELEMLRGYRRVVPDFARWQADLASADAAGVDRGRLVAVLKPYFMQQKVNADWKTIDETPDDRLVTSLAMICPFAPQEKQALLEVPTMAERSRLMTALIEMAILGPSGGEAARH